MSRKLRISTIVFSAALLSGEAWAGGIHPSVEARLRNLPPGQKLAVIVEMTEKADLARIAVQNSGRQGKARVREVVGALRSVANRNQAAVRRMLAQFQDSRSAERVITFWIFNGFAVTATEPVIRSLAVLPDVGEIRLDAQIPLPAPAEGGSGEPTLTGNEWNIDLIRAPEVWAMNPAYQGTGAVIGSFDTGVDLTHPDLYSRYRGDHHISWFDPYGEHAFPFDSHGHGTHTTGTALGGNASGTAIGVAPGATWIAAKAWNDSGFALASVFHQIFEWFLAPGGDPDNAPDVVTNSWVFDETGCQAEFMPDVNAWRAAGIFPAFASGNEGPGAGTVRSPGAYPQAFTVGATGFLDEVAWFSSEGPSPCSNALKPNIGAPGDGIFSAVPGGYAVLSGTSMATPHISGAVAVLRSINPAMTVEDLEFALTAGARDIADPGPDNSSGAGRLDLFVSAQIALHRPGFPVVKVLASATSATEAGTIPGAFTISRTGGTDADLVVNYTVSGTATPGSDYAPLPGSVTIPAGLAAVVVPVVPYDDPQVEFDESVILTLAPSEEYVVSGSDAAAVTIVSDELIPDLLVSALTIPTVAGAGQSIIVSDTTWNRGGGAAESSVTRYYLSSDATFDASDIPIGSRSIPALAGGASSAGTAAAVLPQQTAAATWYVIARADAGDALLETSETNNTYARPIQIGADLMISTFAGPASAGAGQSITVSDTTRNQGGGAAGASITRYYLSSNGSLDASDFLIASRNVPALGPGAEWAGSATAAIPAGAATGTWYLIVRTDADGAVGETNENNNTTYGRSIQIGPDLVISTMSAPSAAGAGQTINVSDTTRNQGGGAADASVTKYYLSSNGSLDAADLLIGTRSVPALAPAADSAGAVAVTIPPGVSTGTWYLISRTDADQAVAETNENNNTTYGRSIQIGADLVISTLSAPAAAGAGQSISLTDTARNQGGGAAGASATRYYLSSNSTLDAGDILIGSRTVPALGAGETNSGTAAVTIPQDTATATWYIIAQADGDDAVQETSESNNGLSKTIRIGADLMITALSAPAAAGAGQSISVSDTVRNQGGGAAAASVTALYLSGNSTLDAGDPVIGSRNVPALAPGTESSGPATVTIPAGTTAGTWYLIGKADDVGVVAESNESNNTYTRSIQIGSDLMISALSAPAAAGAGQSIGVTETTRNQGGGTAEASITRYFLSNNGTLDAADVAVGNRDIPALAAGASSSGTATVLVPEGTATGTWYLIAKADADGGVAESNENNNVYARSIQIGSDLVIPALSAPSSAGAGQSIGVSDTTRNQGGGTTGASVTAYYLSSNGTLDASDTVIGSRNVPPLVGGASSAGTVTVVIPQGTATGTWYILAKADADGAVVEIYENNNVSYARSVQIGSDLSLSALSAPAAAGAGQNISVSDTTRNLGGGTAEASVTKYYLSSNSTIDDADILLGSRSLPALAAGAADSGGMTVMIPAGTAGGTWFIIAKADADGAVTETSDSNNIYWRSIFISAGVGPH